jgi:WXXGXW repeat (2 copies)
MRGPRKILGPASIAGLALLGLTYCASNPPPDEVYLESGPPPARVDVIGTAPGPGYIWIEGHWGWGGSAYQWVPGRWEQPPSAHRHWERGEWRHTSRGWYWRGGHWH